MKSAPGLKCWHRDAEITCLKAVLAGEDPEQAKQDKAAAQTRLQEDFRFLAAVNQGSESMEDADIERIHAIAGQTWTRHFSDRLGLSEEEQQALKGHPEPPLPATETLLADKPGHLRAWGEHVPPVRKDDRRTAGASICRCRNTPITRASCIT